MNDRARKVWARTRLLIRAESYSLASLPKGLLAEAAALVASGDDGFAALILERDEVSVTVKETLWARSSLRTHARAETGSLRAITMDIDVELELCGYLAPAATLLAEAGVSIVPQCAYLKDHLLVRNEQLATARRVLEALILDCRSPG